jgi:hypothetical protein
MAADVFFTDFRSTGSESLLKKLRRLMKSAGFEKIDFQNKYVAVKVHFGEPGNMAYIRPNYAKVVADYVKDRGGRPFLTDCNTLYVGRRGNALSHLEGAYENGWSPFSTNCHIIIADGLKGTDEAHIEVKGGEYVKKARIGRAIADADIIISLNHFKGHESAGFGGALKNLGMGCGSRAGKMEQHCEGKVKIRKDRCVGCKKCVAECAQFAISYPDGKAAIDGEKCVGCGRCIGECNFNAIYNPNSSSVKLFNYKMAEYAKAVTDGKPHFHINMIMDISPVCDCRAQNDAPLIADVGMAVSFDPVAIDQASVDLCNAMPPLPSSQLAEGLAKHEDLHDHFKNTNVNSDYKSCLANAQKIGVGSREYNLVTIK